MTNNPATLGLMPEGNRIDLAFGILRPSVTFHAWDRRYDSDSTKFIFPAGGFVQRRGDWACGIGYTPGEMYSQVIVGKVILPLACNVTDKLTVAGTAEYVLADMDLVMGPFNFKNSSDFSGAASGKGYTGKIGMVYKIHERFPVGSAYQFRRV